MDTKDEVYIEFTREPFEKDYYTVILPDGNSYEVPVVEQQAVLRRLGLAMPPELLIDALFNFNNVLWFPDTGRMEIL